MPRKVKPVVLKEEEEDDGVKIYLPGESDSEVEQAQQEIQQESETEKDSFEKGESKILITEIPKKSRQELKKLNSKQQKPTEKGVVYLGRIPHGFFEEEMQGYFSQFGTVTRLRLSRNKKTGKSKHYAFIEFESSDVAKIVAETMDNYLLANHVLKCSLVPKEKVHEELFKGAGKKFKKLPLNKIQRRKQNSEKTEEEIELQVKGLLEKDERKRKQLKELGIDYEFEGHKKRMKADTSAEAETVDTSPVKKQRVVKATKENDVIETSIEAETKPIKKQRVVKASKETDVIETSIEAETKPIKKQKVVKASKDKDIVETAIEAETKPIKKQKVVKATKDKDIDETSKSHSENTEKEEIPKNTLKAKGVKGKVGKRSSKK
jgi:nucleolar protein 15